MKDPAFQSQQFAEQVAQRKQRSLEIQGNAGFQAGEMFLRSMQTASTVASQQVERQQAMEELAWARELHNTDMLELQKKGLAAQVDASRAQADLAIAKAKRESEGLVDYPMGIDEDQRDALLSQGIDMSFRGGRPVAVEATEDRKSEGLSRLEQRRAQKYMAGLTEAQIRAESGLTEAQIRAKATTEAAKIRSQQSSGSARGAIDTTKALLDAAKVDYNQARERGSPEEQKAAAKRVKDIGAEMDKLQKNEMRKAGLDGADTTSTQTQDVELTPEQIRQQQNDDILRVFDTLFQQRYGGGK